MHLDPYLIKGLEESTQSGFVLLSTNLEILEFSKRAEVYFGLNKGDIGRSIFNLALGHFLIDSKMELLSDPKYTTNFQILGPEKVYYRFHIGPYQTANLEGFLLTITDINESKQNEIFLEDAQTDARIGSWILDLKTGSTKWSEEVYHIYEIPTDTPTNLAQGKAAYPEEDQKRLEVKIGEAMKGVAFEDIYKFITSNNDVKYVRVTGKPVRDDTGEIVALRGSIQDITSYYLKEATTREALASSKTAIFEWFPLKEEMIVDENWHNLFEVCNESPSDNYRTFLSTIHPEDREDWEEVSKVALDEMPNFDISYRLVTARGDIKFIQGRFNILRNQNHDPVRVIGTLTDVTRMRRTETELKEQYKIMAQSTKLAQLGEITAGLAHEINNPLAIAVGNHRLIEKLLTKHGNLPKEVLPTLEKSLADQYESLERIKKLVKNLKNFSHSKGQENQIFDLSQAVYETCELFKILLNRNKILLTLDVQDGLTTRGNKERFNQVLTNLLSNTIDALEQTDKKSVVIRAKLKGNRIQFSIKDNGEGINEEIRDRIFDQFFTTKDVGKGTGIGLALCRSIVVQMGGELYLNENYREGAEFFIEVPYVDPHLVTGGLDQSLTAIEKEQLSRLRGAIIDDDEGVAQLFRAEVSELGPHITVFNSPLKFLDFLEKHKANNLEEGLNKVFDFIVSDVNMAEMTGLELCQKLSEDYGFSKSQLYILSGGMPNFLERKLKFIAQDIFSKPIDINHIGHALINVPTQVSRRKFTTVEALREVLDFCEFVGPKIKTSFVLCHLTSQGRPTLFVNPTFTHDTGYEMEEVIGKNLNILQGPDSDSSAITFMRKCFERQDTCVVDIKNYKKNGSPFTNRLVMIPLCFGNELFYIGLQTNLDRQLKDGKTILHADIQTTINLPISKTIQKVISLFYTNQLKGNLLTEVANEVLAEVERVNTYILKM